MLDSLADFLRHYRPMRKQINIYRYFGQRTMLDPLVDFLVSIK